MIDILNPQLDSTYADYWGEYLPFALENWGWIVKAGCYQPRWYQAPTNAGLSDGRPIFWNSVSLLRNCS